MITCVNNLIWSNIEVQLGEIILEAVANEFDADVGQVSYFAVCCFKSG